MKKIRKSLIFFTILTLIMITSVFVLPSILFADTQTFTPVGPFTNYDVGTWYDVYFHFDLSGIDRDSIQSAVLRVWVQDSNQTNNNVVLNGNILGQLQTGEPILLSEFYITGNNYFSNNGDNTVCVDIGYEGGPEWIRVYDSELVVTTGSGEAEVETWVRTSPFKCREVWINEDNNFEFIFWYLYKSNNWVRIYDMGNNLVFEQEMFADGSHTLEVDLPDGMYTVKTFWMSDEPIQEFIIGKP